MSPQMTTGGWMSTIDGWFWHVSDAVLHRALISAAVT
jgi:hypothetical protein